MRIPPSFSPSLVVSSWMRTFGSKVGAARPPLRWYIWSPPRCQVDRSSGLKRGSKASRRLGQMVKTEPLRSANFSRCVPSRLAVARLHSHTRFIPSVCCGVVRLYLAHFCAMSASQCVGPQRLRGRQRRPRCWSIGRTRKTLRVSRSPRGHQKPRKPDWSPACASASFQSHEWSHSISRTVTDSAAFCALEKTTSSLLTVTVVAASCCAVAVSSFLILETKALSTSSCDVSDTSCSRLRNCLTVPELMTRSCTPSSSTSLPCSRAAPPSCLHLFCLSSAMTELSACPPALVSRLVPSPPVSPRPAILSPLVSAPSPSSLRATAEPVSASPAASHVSSTYSGGRSWLVRWVRPNCCTTLEADQPSSGTMWTRRRWLASFLSACSETPVAPASLRIAISFSPD
mmetsp:Transcript_25791/g.85983  ORF Transcript_25791/g.85983 Transcript_25791/m.85983 type:complete len:401 (-) Transcript_25791:1555-2757(-)